jgi:hypothetical protein
MKSWRDYESTAGLVRVYQEPGDCLHSLKPLGHGTTFYVDLFSDPEAAMSAVAESANGDVIALRCPDAAVEAAEPLVAVLRVMIKEQGRDVEVRVVAPYQDDPRYRDAVSDLFYWQYCDSTSFNSKVFELLQKADWENQHRIHRGWPWLYHAWRDWNAAGDLAVNWFTRYGCVIKGHDVECL